MRISQRTGRALLACLGGALAPLLLSPILAVAAPGEPRTVRAHVQTRPGGPRVEADMPVHEVPVNLPAFSAAEAPLQDGDLVLGVVLDGQPKAFPVRYLAMHEVIDDRVGKTPVAPTW